MKKFLLIIAVAILVVMINTILAETEGNWFDAPVISKAYVQSVGKLYVEWEGSAPVYQVYLDGSKIADTTLNHQVVNIEKGSHLIWIYPLNEERNADTKLDVSVGSDFISGGINIDLSALGLDPKRLVPGNPSEKLSIDYKPNQIVNAAPEKISAVTDSENRVILSFEDPYVSDEFLLTIKHGRNTNYLTFARNGETEKDLIDEKGSIVSLTLDPAYLRAQECVIPEVDEEYRFTVQLRKYGTDLVSGEKIRTIVNDSQTSGELLYKVIPMWRIAPVISFASQTADGQITLKWDHEDYGYGCNYIVMKINKVLGVMTGEEELGRTKDHEFIVNDLNNGGYCINIVPILNGTKGTYSADANIEIKNEWVVAPDLHCEQVGKNQVKLTWKAPENIEKYHITVSRGDNNSLLRFVDLDYSKYTELDLDAAEGDMEYIFTYDEPIDPENGTKLKFDIYGIRHDSSGREQMSSGSSKTVVVK